MASPVESNQVLAHPENAQISIAVGGSALVVLNKNSKATNDYTNPWLAAGGSGSNAANIVMVPTNFASYLDLYHIWGDANSPTTAPIVRVWGRLRRTAFKGADCVQPYDVNQTVFPNTDDWWVPLIDPSPPTGASNNYELDMGTTAIGAYAAGGTGILLSAGRKIFCAGTEKIMVLVRTAGDQTEAGVIAGHFIR